MRIRGRCMAVQGVRHGGRWPNPQQLSKRQPLQRCCPANHLISKDNLSVPEALPVRGCAARWRSIKQAESVGSKEESCNTLSGTGHQQLAHLCPWGCQLQKPLHMKLCVTFGHTQRACDTRCTQSVRWTGCQQSWAHAGALTQKWRMPSSCAIRRSNSPGLLPVSLRSRTGAMLLPSSTDRRRQEASTCSRAAKTDV